MHYRVVGLGESLAQPCETSASGLLADALRAADRLFTDEPGCEAVEIFSGQHYMLEVARPKCSASQ